MKTPGSEHSAGRGPEAGRAVAPGSAGALAMALRRRGHVVQSLNPREQVLAYLGGTEAQREAFYQRMRRYSFRLLLRDVIARRSGFTEAEVGQFATPAVRREDLAFLVDMGVVWRKRTGFRLATRAITSFGETLEWYVAAALERELGFSTAWSVILAGESTRGDYDVLAHAEGRLVYVETKSSPPKNIYESQVAEFLARMARLEPDLAVFLVDTELRLEDKVLKLFQAAAPRGWKRRFQPAARPRPIYRIAGGLCIASAKRDLVDNLGQCVAGLFRPMPSA